MLTFVCWKWQGPKAAISGIRYDATHVNTLYSMLKRHYRNPFELVCITDNSAGINPDIRIVPMWDEGLLQYGACFVRLKCFAPEMADIIAPEFVSIDLDVVITADITDLFDGAEDFKIWSARPDLDFMPYCGSLFYMKAGARRKVWDSFSTNDLVFGTHSRTRKEIWFNSKSAQAGFLNGTDQAWIATCLYPQENVWTPEDDGIYVFNAHIRKRDEWRTKTIYVKDNNGKKRRKQKCVRRADGPDGTLPENTKMVFFSGPHDPTQKELQRDYPWIAEHYH